MLLPIIFTFRVIMYSLGTIYFTPRYYQLNQEFYILIESSPFHIFPLLLLHLSQIVERTNVLSKIHQMVRILRFFLLTTVNIIYFFHRRFYSMYP